MCYLLAYINSFFVYLVLFFSLSLVIRIYFLVSLFTVVFVCIGACVDKRKKDLEVFSPFFFVFCVLFAAIAL